MQHLSRKAAASISVSITGREIYDLLMEMRHDVQELSGKVDIMPTRLKNHEGRPRYLERAVWGYAGVAAVGGGLLGQVVRTWVGVGESSGELTPERG